MNSAAFWEITLFAFLSRVRWGDQYHEPVSLAELRLRIKSGNRAEQLARSCPKVTKSVFQLRKLIN